MPRLYSGRTMNRDWNNTFTYVSLVRFFCYGRLITRIGIARRYLLANVIWRSFHRILGLGGSAEQHALRASHVYIVRHVEILQNLLSNSAPRRRHVASMVMRRLGRIQDYRHRDCWIVD